MSAMTLFRYKMPAGSGRYGNSKQTHVGMFAQEFVNLY